MVIKRSSSHEFLCFEKMRVCHTMELALLEESPPIAKFNKLICLSALHITIYMKRIILHKEQLFPLRHSNQMGLVKWLQMLSN